MYASDYVGSETIRKYEIAAEKRYLEAVSLELNGFDLGAIYLFGYSIEMWITAAYFRLRGFIPTRVINAEDRNLARASALNHNVVIDREHDLLGWARLLVFERRALSAGGRIPTPVSDYPPGFGQKIIDEASDAYAVWKPGLRYSPHDPEGSDSIEVNQAADWFKENYLSM